MTYGLYVMKDEKVGFLQVFQDSNDYTAERNFRFSMGEVNSLFRANKKDFSLWKVGTFDSNTGEVTLEPQIKLLHRAEDFADEV